MAFSKLTVLALLALQSITAYADPDVSFTVTFPGNKDPLPYLVHNYEVTMDVTIKNNGPEDIHLVDFSGKLTSPDKSPYHYGRDVDYIFNLRTLRILYDIPAREETSIAYSSNVHVVQEAIRTFPGDVRLEVMARFRDNNNDYYTFPVYNQTLKYYNNIPAGARPQYLRDSMFPTLPHSKPGVGRGDGGDGGDGGEQKEV